MSHPRTSLATEWFALMGYYVERRTEDEANLFGLESVADPSPGGQFPCGELEPRSGFVRRTVCLPINRMRPGTL